MNPQLPKKAYAQVLREDGYPLHDPFSWVNAEEIEQTLEVLAQVLQDISPTNSQLIRPEHQDPSGLADRVWQTIWLASGENPDKCLATFVEIFIFKFLSDLGVLTTNDTGIGVSFTDARTKDRDTCYKFYHAHVRPHIKHLFPPSAEDGSSVINGTVLDPEVHEHNRLFHDILDEFEKFGSLTHIEPEFKSRLYERFMKNSPSQTNWGQFFTPRNIVKAMVEMSEIDKLPDGAAVHDPACGVGGFILEPTLTKRTRDYSFKDGELRCKLNYTGHDRDLKTVILAKANMLIHLNELLRTNRGTPQAFAAAFNETFRSFHTSILGSISETPSEVYDLVLTNPPFVVEGTSKIKGFSREEGRLKDFYKVSGFGVEGLFLEKIIHSIKPGGKALVIVPDGLLNRIDDKKLRAFIRDKCYLHAVVSIPKRAFYTTEKKTYILVLQKKEAGDGDQKDPVFSYVVTRTGETLDASRFEDENDLPEMVRLFKYFKADPIAFESPTPKCKVWPVSRFAPDTHWSVDRWWTHEERVALGVADADPSTTLDEFTDQLDEEATAIGEAAAELRALDSQSPELGTTVKVSLSDKAYFDLFIGKRVTKKELIACQDGQVPVYSANAIEPWGYLDDSNISDFTDDFVLWGIDGDWGLNVMRAGTKFRTTDHCGAIRILHDQIDADYLYYALRWVRDEEGLDRTLRANLRNMKRLSVPFPVRVDGEGEPQVIEVDRGDEKIRVLDLDLERQQEIAAYYRAFEEARDALRDRFLSVTDVQLLPPTA